jgi:hypothetical protein
MWMVPEEPSEELRIQSELLAVHAVISRGANLFTDAMERLASGEPTDVGSLCRFGTWLFAFIRQHHISVEETLWPMLRAREPAAAADLDWLTTQHAIVAGDLISLDSVLSQLEALTLRPPLDAAAASVGLTALQGFPVADGMRSTLRANLAAEEPVMRILLPLLTTEDVQRFRAEALATAPRTGLDLLLGIMQDPEPVIGHDLLLGHMSAQLRDRRPLLLRRYRALKASLLA